MYLENTGAYCEIIRRVAKLHFFWPKQIFLKNPYCVVLNLWDATY